MEDFLRRKRPSPPLLTALPTHFSLRRLAAGSAIYNGSRQVLVPAANTPYYNMGAGWGDAGNGEHWPTGTSFDGNLVGNPPQPPNGGLCAINCSNYPGRNFYSFHTGGVNVCIADGSVRFLAESVPTRVFAFMITMAKGEVVPAN